MPNCPITAALAGNLLLEGWRGVRPLFENFLRTVPAKLGDDCLEALAIEPGANLAHCRFKVQDRIAFRQG